MAPLSRAVRMGPATSVKGRDSPVSGESTRGLTHAANSSGASSPAGVGSEAFSPAGFPLSSHGSQRSREARIAGGLVAPKQGQAAAGQGSYDCSSRCRPPGLGARAEAAGPAKLRQSRRRWRRQSSRVPSRGTLRDRGRRQATAYRNPPVGRGAIRSFQLSPIGRAAQPSSLSWNCDGRDPGAVSIFERRVGRMETFGLAEGGVGRPVPNNSLVLGQLARGVVAVDLAGGVGGAVEHHLQLAVHGDELPAFARHACKASAGEKT